MKIIPCPKCGRDPKIKECVSHNERRRLCYCPNYCGVLPNYKSMFVFTGDGDDNDIYKEWNDYLKEYKL